MEKALRDAAEASEREEKRKREKQKKKREALVKKVKRKLQMIFYGPKYHAAMTKPKKKKFKTVRTKVTEHGLKHGGLTKKEIAKLRD